MGTRTSKPSERPNILYIFTDQQQANMMSCAGNPYLRTPAMDSLAATGVRFDKAYCANPVCLPSRYSMMTGRMPGDIGIRSNIDGAGVSVSQADVDNTIGWSMRLAGYDVAYGGKVHLPNGMDPESMGFQYLTDDERDGLANTCADFISEPREKPFMLIASFINPHDICYMAIRDFGGDDFAGISIGSGLNEIENSTLDSALKIPEGVSREEFFKTFCPPVPDNLEPQNDEPEAVRMIVEQRPFKKHAREDWDEEKWRMHRWAYCRLTEMADLQIATVLKSLRDTNQEENTLVIFSTDHGDMDGSHRMEHKTVLYEEAIRVPLIISWKGITPAEKVDSEHLVSNGLDLVPTLCDFAGVNPPEGLEGRSLRPLVEGTGFSTWRDMLRVESEFGHMSVDTSYKYVLYDEGDNREQFINLELDPGENVNLVNSPDLKDTIDRHRRWLASRIQST